MHNQPSGAAYDVVLLLHVACVVIGIVTVATAAATARRLGRLAGTASPLPEPLRRYFRPGVNWAGRTIYGIPVFGFALLGMSHGAYGITDAWVLSGVVLFVALALLAEGVLWPAERRLQHAIAAAETPGPRAAELGPPPARTETVTADAARMERAASIGLVVLVVATVLMIAQP
jgi:small-conductance mechanosensitive channel